MTSESLPYRAIPAPAGAFTPGSVLSRFMDGLGFRYYWATEGLSEGELEYRAVESARSVGETLGHVHNLLTMVEHAFTGEIYDIPEPGVELELDALRTQALGRIESISARLKKSEPEAFDRWEARFRIGGEVHNFPFWNAINGVMSDALYHVGQVVSLRRAAGNPMDPAVNVYLGMRLDG